jgi:hypothetical protein
MKNYYEWFIILFISGSFGPYTIYIYNLDNHPPSYLLYLSVFLILLSLVASAKLGLANPFKVIRMIPKWIKNAIPYLTNDYKHWRYNGGIFSFNIWKMCKSSKRLIQYDYSKQT